MRIYHRDGTLPPPGTAILVFGANLAGRHGAGAAKIALKYGARYGRGVGISGATYAIPTKDEDIKTLPLDIIETYVRQFVDFTIKHSRVNFWITAVGTGLAGYKDSEIAPMFKNASMKCSFAEQWRPFLEPGSSDV